LGRFAFLDVQHERPDGVERNPRWTVALGRDWRLALEAVEGEDALGIMEVRCRD
jgi:hypothetical protein